MMHKSGTSDKARSARLAPGSPRQPVNENTLAAEWGHVSESWVILRVKPRTEFETAEALSAQGRDALVPFERKYRRFGRHRARVLCCYPLFPCYVFAEWPENGHSASHSVIRSVLGVMTVDERPYRLSVAEIAWVRTLSDGQTEVAGLNIHHALRAGQWAQIAEGPMVGLAGYIDAIRGSRASVLMEMLGVWRSVEIPLDVLEVA